MQFISELHYFPNVYFFQEFCKHDTILIEASENFEKQTLRNRTQILTAQGILDLSVPIQKTESKHIKDTKIDNNQRWREIHWRSIKTAYGKSPYFEFYCDKFEALILTKYTYLFDFNLQILTKCLEIMKIKKEIILNEIYQKSYSNEDVVDIRNKNLPIQSQIEYKIGNNKKYYQTFGNTFVDRLSIIDLIFNEGTNSKQILYT